jgi:hypothetical protein
MGSASATTTVIGKVGTVVIAGLADPAKLGKNIRGLLVH